MKTQKVTFKVNGEKHELLVEPNALLVNVLREELGLTGTKYTCGTGQCGACTVLVNGDSVLSCLTLAVAVDGSEIQTIEGLAKPDGTLDPVQEAFLDHSAIQCGYCTPGMVLMGKEILDKNPSPTSMFSLVHGLIDRCDELLHGTERGRPLRHTSAN